MGRLFFTSKYGTWPLNFYLSVAQRVACQNTFLFSRIRLTHRVLFGGHEKKSRNKINLAESFELFVLYIAARFMELRTIELTLETSSGYHMATSNRLATHFWHFCPYIVA